MKHTISHIKVLKRLVAVSFPVLLMLLFTACELQKSYEYEYCKPSPKLNMTAWEFISSHDSLDLLEQCIFLTGLENYYQEDVVRTFIAPTNEGIQQYLSEHDYASIEDVPLPILRNVLKYHMVNARVTFTDPELSASNQPIAYPCENGQIMYLSHNTGYQGLVNQGTKSRWTIATSNLEPTNGIIHVIASVVYFAAEGGDTSHDIAFETDTIYPLHDAFVNAGSLADENYGSDSILKVQHVSGHSDSDQKAYLMFNLGEFEKEADVIGMELEMAVNLTGGAGAGLKLYAVQDQSWDESGLTWNNAPAADPDPLAGIATTAVSAFSFDLGDYYKGLTGNETLSLMLDGEAGSGEANEFASKEHEELPAPMMIATYSGGAGDLKLTNNTGLSLESGGAFVLSSEVLEVTGTAPENIIYVLEEAPLNGWLFIGASVLEQGDRFTQMDVNLMNVLYVHDGLTTADHVVLSVMDKSDAYLDDFNVEIAIQ
ncbi:MAG: hypothetical protein CSA96_00570 [Bacteroidetes bacterium]|nr:MAG: hypothetical protein CSA96_00570 [Bacteroidota bacterium]